MYYELTNSVSIHFYNSVIKFNILLDTSYLFNIYFKSKINRGGLCLTELNLERLEKSSE